MGYSVRKWAVVRGHYETGNFSVKELGKKCGISERAIENRISKAKEAGDPWIKGKLKPQIEAAVEKTTVEMFAEAGLQKSDMIQKMADGLQLGETTLRKMGDYLNQVIQSDTVVSSRRMMGFAKQYITDMKTELDYAKEINRMTGWLAPAKIARTDPEGKPEPPPAPTYDYNKLTIKELKTLRGLLAKCTIRPPADARSGRG